MMTLNLVPKCNSVKDLADLHERLSTLFGGAAGKTPPPLSQWIPAVDIAEDDKGYIFTAEIPEVKGESLKVKVEDGSLVIAGERESLKEEKTIRYHRVERGYGAFHRSFGLPEDADTTKVEASFNNGLLKVIVLKREETKPKEIEVKIS